MKINKEDHNYYGFDIDEVCKHFEGDLTYVNTFCVKGNYLPVAVFHNGSPNREKNHKDFMLLWLRPGLDRKMVMMVSGMDLSEMENHRYQKGMYCPDCKNVIYSINRHDYRKCTCGRCMVDGGKDYFRTNMAGEVVSIDLLCEILGGDCYSSS